MSLYKRGFIDNSLPNILTCLGISTENWLMLTRQFETLFPSHAGNSQSAGFQGQRVYNHKQQRFGIGFTLTDIF